MSHYYGDPENERVFIYDNNDAAEYIRADLVPQWQPIETAPKDGTVILLWNDRCELAFWNGRSWDDGDFHDDLGHGFTHWQPLPTPPPAT